MDREEILRAVQAEKQETGEYEKNVTRKAIMYGAALGVGLCTVMSVVELWIFKKMDFGKPTILLAISGFANLYEGKRIRKKRAVLGGVIELVIATLGLILYVGALLI